MIPILFDSTATTFTTFGIGHLTDAISPHVVEERNGEFSFEMQYPVDGEHYDSIGMRSIILAKPNPQQDAQPFRVYRITKPINGIVTVFANHLRYDLAGVPVAPFTASSLNTALSAMVSNRLVSSPFTFTTDKWSDTDMTSLVPTSTLALMGGQQGSLLDVYGGEWLTDGYSLSLLDARGSNNNVVIRYGVDLIDMEQEENCSNCYTGVICFWKSMEGDELVSGTIQSAGTFDYTRILVVDRSGNYENAPTAAQLNVDAVNYINNNNVGVPKVSLTVSFVDLAQTEEYANIRQSLALCDYVKVLFEKLGVEVTAKVIRTDYDVINERYISVEIGESRGSIADTIVGISTKVDSVPTTTEMQQAIAATTAAITGAEGGAVRLLDTNNDDLPDTLYIADDPDPSIASKVWRFNYEGWGASEDGYSGPFTMGATFTQGFIADFITAGTLSADRIGANSISVSKLTGSISNGNWEIDLDNGTLTIGDISADNITSGTIDASNITVTNLNADNITTGTINGQRITDNTITGTKIQDLSLTGSKIQASTITGSNIDSLTITGDNIANTTLAGTKIAYNTLSDTQIASQGVSTASLSSGITTSLSYADDFNAATIAGTNVYPALFKAGYITAAETFTGRDITVSPSGSEITLGGHYHTILVNGGVVTIGRPYNSNTAPSFNIADTQFYKDGVAAERVTSLDIAYEYDYSMHVYKLSAYAYNQSGTLLKSTTGWNTDRSAYIDGQNSGTSYADYIYTTSSAWTSRNGHPVCEVTTIVYGITSGGSYVQLASGTVDYERPY